MPERPVEPPLNCGVASTEPPQFAVGWVALWRHRIDVEPARDDYAWDASPGWQTMTVTRFTTYTGSGWR